MNTSINFLSQRQKAIAVSTLADRKYLVWMSYVLGGVVIAGIVIFGLDFFLQRSIQRVIEEQADVDTQLASHAQIESEYLQLAQKVQELDQLLTGRVEKRQTLQFFTGLFLTDEVRINEIEFTSSSALNFDLVTSNVFTMERAMNQLESADVQSRFASLTTTDLVRNIEGQYTVRVTVGLKSPEAQSTPIVTPTPTL